MNTIILRVHKSGFNEEVEVPWIMGCPLPRIGEQMTFDTESDSIYVVNNIRYNVYINEEEISVPIIKLFIRKI